MIADNYNIEWGIRFEEDDFDMSGSHEKTTTMVASENAARNAERMALPRKGRNHRVVRRMVSEWEEIK
ncbi:hypothetical protein PP304_gp054 [Gordonia phage Phendrix]|uniref:Uncharacterized protein n=1 Tax=Gordonia phage Phendrix TaxID=2593335 RepID=A0A514U0Y3_9CAUD|nr:hypothetical protein PP304_gp054 [Gordonia phage Phendrix]QDK02602.1 hypothetical protein SEA_PHENDRIX_54 [Gordonia phage Phendrix]